jgi:hypothetical protein
MSIEGVGGLYHAPPPTLRTLAAVCKRGHLVTVDAGRIPEPSDVAVHCQDCGARAVRACGACEAPLLGVAPFTLIHRRQPLYTVEAPAWTNESWLRPEFCWRCGSPWPWVDRAGRIHHLENLLDDEDMEPATELAIREQLAALADPDLDDREVERRWRKVVELAPEFWEKSGARAVATTLMTAAVKRALGL